MPTLKMKLPHEVENCGHIHQAHQKLFDVAKTIWGLALMVLKEGETFGAGQPEFFNLCLAGAYAKQMRLYLGAYRLCAGGMGNEALLLVRSMYALNVYLEAMDRCDKRPEFARLWLAWNIANQEKQGHGLLRWHPEWKEKVDELSKVLSDEKVKLGDKWKEFTQYGPPMIDLAALCQKLGTEEAYRSFYPFASGPTHGYDILFYARPLSDGKVEVKLSPSEDLVESNLATMASLLRDTTALLNNMLHLKKDAVIEDMTKLVKALMPLIS